MHFFRSALLLPLMLVACSAPTGSTESCDGGHVASPLAAAPALEALAQFPAFVHHRGKGGELVRNANGFAVARYANTPEGAWRPAGRKDWSVTLPAHARGALRLAIDDVSAEIAPLDVDDVEATAIEGAVVARAKGLDLVYVAEPNAIEEIRVLHASAGAHIARWTIKTTSAVRISDDRVEIVNAAGRTKLTSAPIFAVDSRGLKRTPALTIANSGDHEYTIEARLDGRDMVAPIALDPLWNPAESMAKPRVGHTATLLDDGKVLVVGGGGATSSTDAATDIAHNSAEVYDVTTDGWTATPAMSTARMFHAAAKLADGKVMVFGGCLRVSDKAGPFDARVQASTEVYDPASNSWSAGAPMPSARTHHAAITLSDGKVLIVGGTGYFTGTTDLGSPPPLLFDPATKEFSPITGPMGFPIIPQVVPLSGKRFLLSGCNPGPYPSCEVVLFVYDEATKAFTALPAAKRSRSNLRDFALTTTARLPTGDAVLMLGGGDDSVERYDVAAKSSAVSFELDDPWAAMSATALPSGDIIALGGFVSGASPGSVIKPFPLGYLRHAKTNSWLRATQPSTRRWFHTATLLKDGSLMIAGGRNKDGVLASVEIWRPLALGQTCTHGGDCESGFCADGVCCDAKCAGQCQACSSTGKCLPVTGAPRGLRPLCDNPGGDVCKAMVCDGKTIDSCVLPGAAIKCADAVCNASGFTPEAACDGAGACTKPTETACAPYGCTDIGCRTSCSASTECANAAICVSGKCIAAAGGACSTDLTRSIGTDGNETSCQPYKCVQATGKCGESCTSSTECAGGFVCGNGKCQQPAIETGGDDGGGCSTTNARGGAGGLLALMIVLGLMRRRWR